VLQRRVSMALLGPHGAHVDEDCVIVICLPELQTPGQSSGRESCSGYAADAVNLTCG